MGFFRGGLLFFVSVLLLFSLITLGSFLTVAFSLEYDNVKSEVTPIIENLTSGELIDFLPEEFREDNDMRFNLTDEMRKALDIMKKYCENETYYVFSTEGYTFTIPCELVNETPENLAQTGIETIIEQSYYKDYDCGFFDCILKTGNPLALISETAQKYWETRFYFSLLVSLILAGILFFLVESKINFPVVLGSLIIISSLPILRLEGFFSLFLGSLFILFLKIFFSKATTVFWILLIPGIIILAGGIALRIWKPDFIKRKLSTKDIKKIVKEKNKV